MEELLQRAKAAHDNPRFRSADFKPLIADLGEASEQQRAIATQAAADSVDFALSEVDRDEAAAKAGRARRNAAALTAAVEALTAKLAERKASEKAHATEAERQAAIAERDEIAKEVEAIFRPFTEAGPAVLAKVLANAERMRAAGLRDPDAEAVARGIPGNWYLPGGFTPVMRLAEMKIPAFDGQGRRWPPEALPVDSSVVRRRTKAVAAAAKAKQEAVWGWFRLTPSGWAQHPFSYQVILPERGETGLVKQRGLFKHPWSGNIARSEAARLTELGVKVEEIDRATAEAEQIAREKAADERDGIYYRR